VSIVPANQLTHAALWGAGLGLAVGIVIVVLVFLAFSWTSSFDASPLAIAAGLVICAFIGAVCGIVLSLVTVWGWLILAGLLTLVTICVIIRQRRRRARWARSQSQ